MNVAVKHNGGDHVNEPSTTTSTQKWGIFFLFGSGSCTLVGLERDFQLAIKLQQTNGIKVGISTRKGNNILIKMRGHVKGRAHATPNSSLGPAGKLHGDEEKHKRIEAATCSKAVKRELQDTAVTDSVAGWNGEGSTVKSLAHETPRRRGARRLMMDPAAAPCYTSSVKQQHSRYTSRVGVHVISGEACAEGRMKMESPLLSFAWCGEKKGSNTSHTQTAAAVWANRTTMIWLEVEKKEWMRQHPPYSTAAAINAPITIHQHPSRRITQQKLQPYRMKEDASVTNSPYSTAVASVTNRPRTVNDNWCPASLTRPKER
ncbi:hypothetical protein LR48_Vigan04g149900 [Vigna angularis]|uniref:Uncharacterized protein n=1 Tax=Phaseolus angularis TaxID=3914 RepID=A0A0L9UEZ1_PHAAN|nr:hypothetical protein LR48_Vigan04g149900 [Vigna angularis]